MSLKNRLNNFSSIDLDHLRICMLSPTKPGQLCLHMMPREQELTQKGWTRQSTHDEPRLSDVVEAYEEMGLEVHLEPFHPEDEQGCTECMQVSPERYKTVYTRSKTLV